jgi:hypothetical protein
VRVVFLILRALKSFKMIQEFKKVGKGQCKKAEFLKKPIIWSF